MKNKITIALIIFLLIENKNLLAQNNLPNGEVSQNMDVLYLKNGSVLRGTLQRYSPKGDTLYFLNRNGLSMAVSENIIKKIVQYDAQVLHYEKPYLFREKGIWGAITVNGMLGRTGSDNSPTLGTGITGVIGWRENRWQNWGIGVSYDQYYIGSGNSAMLATFAEWRGMLRASRVSEVFSVSAGWGVPLSEVPNTGWAVSDNKNVSGGFYFHPAIGWRIGASSRYNFIFDVGVRFQNAIYRSENTWLSRDYHVLHRRSVVRLGILF